jgi:hypothetical protein
VTDTSSDNVGTITLVATKAAAIVLFKSGASKFNKGIIVQAKAGIVMSMDVTTQLSESVYSAGTGTLSIASTKSLITSNQILKITADDIDFSGTAVNSGTAAMTIVPTTTTKTIGIGTTTADMDIEAGELADIDTTGGLTIGSLSASGSITVTGITKDNSNDIAVKLTLIATSDTNTITFTGGSSTFHSLAVQADHGISLAANTDLTTTTATLHLDSDYENGGDGDIQFASGAIVTAATQLTLDPGTATIVRAAALTLAAGAGVVLHEDMTTTTADSALVIDADDDGSGDGTLTLVSTKVITSNKSDVTITAWDIDLAGSLTAGTEAISIHGSAASQTIGLGSAFNMHLSDDELGKLTSEAGLAIGSAHTGKLVVNGVTDTSSDNVGTITLVATKTGIGIVFGAADSTAASAFQKGIVVQANNGVVLSESLTTKTSITVINTGTGTLKSLATKSLLTTNQPLTM